MQQGITWFRRKRWWSLGFILLLVIALFFTWNSRNQVAKSLVQPYLAPYQLQLDCIDWSLDAAGGDWSKPVVDINKLCLKHTDATIIIEHLKADDLKSPSLVTIERLRILSNKTLGQLTKIYASGDQKSQLTLSQLLMQLHHSTTFRAPINFEIKHLQLIMPQLNQPVMASISQNDQTLILKLKQQNQNLFVQSNHSDPTLAINANVDVNTLINIAKQQQLALPATIAELNPQAKLQVKAGYQNHQLDINYQLTDVAIDKSQLNISANTLQGKVQVTDHQISWENGESPATIIIKGSFKQLATEQKLPAPIIALLNANPIEQLTLQLKSKAYLSWQQNRLNLSDLAVHSNNQLIDAKINKFQLELPNQNYSFALVANGKATLPMLGQWTNQPVAIDINTKIQGNKTNIQLSENSHIKLITNKFKHPKAKIEQLHVTHTGPLSWQTNQLKTNSQWQLTLSQTDLPKLKTIESITINAAGQINSTSQQSSGEIQLNGEPFGQFTSSGELLKPNITFSTKDLSLNKLLKIVELDMPLPTLIAGQLNLNLHAAIKDLQNPFNNNINGQIKIKDVYGDHQQTQFDELNYQQSFNLSRGKLTTTGKNNLSIASIKAGTELQKIQAQLNFKADITAKDIQPTFSVSVENVSTQAFGGKVSFPSFQWPNPNAKAINLKVEGLDLAKIVALEKNQGIVVTGLISGLLPTTIMQNNNKQTITIDNGDLHNITNGIIQIKRFLVICSVISLWC